MLTEPDRKSEPDPRSKEDLRAAFEAALVASLEFSSGIIAELRANLDALQTEHATLRANYEGLAKQLTERKTGVR